MMYFKSHSSLASLLVVGLAVPWAAAQPYTINGGEVNISGATLMRPFFEVPASTNDHIDADGDGCVGGSIPPCPLVDQLAPTFIPATPLTTWWLVQYRGVGSVNGFEEFVKYQTCGTIPTSVPGEMGLFNRFRYAQTGSILWAGPYGDASGTPRSPSSIDLAIVDVESSWAVRFGNAADARWNRAPNVSGYGQNPILSNTGWDSALDDLGRDCVGGDGIDDTFLNTNTANPDADTIFDTRIAWAPVAFITNRGTGVQNINMTQLHHLFVSGRLSSGENLVGATRSAGSGTRNAAMNTAGIDTTWGRGDNLGNEVNSSSRFNLGPLFQPTNAEGSSLVESAVQNNRLAIGYTGLSGASRAADDAKNGRYEIVNVKFDDRGGNAYVRPTIDSVLDNADPNTGYQIGGTATLVSRGDPEETNPASPTYMTNQNAAAYLMNIKQSVEDFVSAPADPANFGSPGEYLATTYFLVAGLDALPQSNAPTNFVAQTAPDFNQAVQDFIRANNGLGIGQDTPAYGSANQAGLSPTRTVNPDFPPLGSPDKYSDGKGSGDAGYCYSTSNVGNGSPATLPAAQRLGQRNRIQGDFNNDGLRNLNDADNLVKAFFAPRQFEMGVVHAGNAGNQSVNTVIPEVIGDFNGDGDFSAEDLRYFADGLAVDPGTGKLDRKLGAIAVDNAIVAYGPATDEFGAPVPAGRSWFPWRDPYRTIVIPPATPCDPPKYMLPTPDVNDAASPFLATGRCYKPGDFRGDIAGATPVPGAQPLGFDNRVDHKDINAIASILNDPRIGGDRVADWSDLNEAVYFDLSADMNGDLLVTDADIDELVVNILKTRRGDVNLDGLVDAADLAIINANLGMSNAGWQHGDMDSDGDVDANDIAVYNANLPGCSAPTIVSAESVKTHAGAGEFGIPMGIAPAVGDVECRLNGVTRIRVTFSGPITAADGCLEVNDEVSVSSTPSAAINVTQVGISTNVLTINLSGVPNRSCLTVVFSGLACDAGAGFPGTAIASFTLNQRVLLGDSVSNGNGFVESNDVSFTKARASLGTVDATSFRADYDADGTVSNADVSRCKAAASLSQDPITCP